jgi:hypothetical protein
MMQLFPMDDYYKIDVISGMGYLRSDSALPLVLCIGHCAMAGAPILYYKSLETASKYIEKG